MNVIFGASGFAKELDWLLFELQFLKSENNSYFVSKDKIGEIINGKEVISEENFLNKIINEPFVHAYLGIGDPGIRRRIFEGFKSQANIEFPNLIYPNVVYDRREGKVQFGIGNVVCAGSVLTTDIKIGNFVHINLDCTIGHDSKIGNFTTISPGVHISGNVLIGNNVFIGTGAVILEKIEISDNVIIGAGALVNKSITEPGVYIGIPAKSK